MIDKNYNYHLLFIFMFFVLGTGFVLSENFKSSKEWEREEARISAIERELSLIDVEAKAFSIYSIDENKKIYGKNDDVPLPLASITKVMTAVVVMDDKRNPNIKISKEALDQPGDSGLLLDEEWDLDDLAKFTLISSSNDGAHAMALSIDSFFEKMNTKAQRIGMENATFYNSTGYDLDKEKAGAYASAHDVNLLSAYALKAYPNIFINTANWEMNFQSKSGFMHNVKNTNLAIGSLPNLLFSKTGFTDIARGNLAIIFSNKYGEKIAVTVLGSTLEGRFSDMEKLVNTLYNIDYGNKGVSEL